MLNPKLKVVFIGGGNMAKSILSGLIADGHLPAHIALLPS